MVDQLQKTVKFYDEKAAVWSSTHGGKDEESWWKKEMSKFHTYLPGGSVIEIGSGTGKDAEALVRLGYKYTGTDASAGLLKLAQERNPKVTFLNKYAHELEPSIGTFDGFWAVAVLLHIPRADIDKTLTAISSVLRTGAIGFITLKEGDGERIDEETGRLFTYYRDPEFKKILERNNFKILETEKKEDVSTWLIYYVEKK